MTDDKEIVVLTGKEAVGKSSLIDYLVENGENKILKLTTRARARRDRRKGLQVCDAGRVYRRSDDAGQFQNRL